MSRLSNAVNSAIAKNASRGLLKDSIDRTELAKAVGRINALGELASRRQRKAMLRPAAVLLRDAARRNIPVSEKPHVGRNGNVYLPGNLRDGIQVKSFRRSLDLFVGPVTRSAATASVFGDVADGQKGGVDAYYAHWMEYGATNRDGTTREGIGYMRRALAETKKGMEALIVRNADRLLKRIVKKVQKQ